MSGLCTEEPQRSDFVHFEAIHWERSRVRCHGHESRINASGHRRAWGCKGTLGEGVVLGVELERHDIADVGGDLVRCKGQSGLADKDIVRRLAVNDRGGSEDSRENSTSGEMHLGNVKLRE